MLNVRELSAGYGGNLVLRDVSFSLQEGTVTALLGANGSGKTTLMKAICGIVPHKGSCLVGDNVLEELAAKQLAGLVSYIPQRSGIAIDLTALEVVLMGFNPQLRLLQSPTREMTKQAQQALEDVGIDATKNYLDLSEGQKQLCILARAMVSCGKVLLLDEPESALDLRNRYEIFRAMGKHFHGKTVLAALHDPQLALQTADTLLLLKDGMIDAVLHPREDDLETMERALSQIYSACRLHRVEDQVVMIKK